MQGFYVLTGQAGMLAFASCVLSLHGIALSTCEIYDYEEEYFIIVYRGVLPLPASAGAGRGWKGL